MSENAGHAGGESDGRQGQPWRGRSRPKRDRARHPSRPRDGCRRPRPTRDSGRETTRPLGERAHGTPEPDVPEEITGHELDPAVRRELGTLAKPTAVRVARHLVAAGQLLEDDPELALEHAQAARRAAPRLGVVREACGLAAYQAGRYDLALAELRAARRMTGSVEYVPVMADCERGLGRPERALDLVASVDRATLDLATRIELLIVEAGARRDLGQLAAALTVLDVPELRMRSAHPAIARLRYAYADTLTQLGRRKEAASWFARAAEADLEGETDAEERYAALVSEMDVS